MRGKHIISYLGVAEPLELAPMYKDVRRAEDGVDEILLWQHQFDWLVKKHASMRSMPTRYVVPHFGEGGMVHYVSADQELTPVEVTDGQAVTTGYYDEPARVFGVPVRIENPGA